MRRHWASESEIDKIERGEQNRLKKNLTFRRTCPYCYPLRSSINYQLPLEHLLSYNDFTVFQIIQYPKNGKVMYFVMDIMSYVLSNM